MSDADADAPRTPAATSYDRWTLELAPLASQHHLSEYSRIKYGHKGCPVLYAPLSLHLPDVVHGLRERQHKCANQVRWWPCTPTTLASPLIPAAQQRAALAAGECIPHPELQQELSSALAESITTQPSHQNQIDATDSPLHIKTSESHPINVSQIIPPESLVPISSHLIPCKKPCPVLFEINLPYALDYIARQSQPSLSYEDPPVSPIRSVHIPPSLQRKTQSNQLRSSVSGVFNAALGAKISLPPLPVPSSKILLSLKRNLKAHPISDLAFHGDATDAVLKLDPCHSTSISQPSQSRLPSMLALPANYALHPFSSHTRPPTAPSPPNKVSRFRSTGSTFAPSSRQGANNQRTFKLGNLLLSSCPGKKVRLTGPVRGRSAVCRDLGTDLRRMKMLGAGCVVCCLDDEELEFLIGVSWIQYRQAAHREGLDVLRIPLPEGLTPLSPESLDVDLDRIIERYTLQGISVLAHCRGGVGRAGLLACCWMLKLGLCGWIETNIPPSATGTSTTTDSETKPDDDVPPENFRWNSETVVRQDTLQLVVRVIEVVRTRRSVKAIETLEQVQFLVEYVDYLRTCGHASDS